jgi:hypothetical protein
MKKIKIVGIIIILLAIAGIFLYFKYFFTYEQKNIVKRNIETITGQNLTVTVFGFDGKIIKRWTNVQKISSGKDRRSYTFFYTRDNKYVQIPDSVWYIAEEE